MMTIIKDEILSTTDVIKNFASCRNKTKEMSRTVIFKNNKPDLVMLDIEEYEKMLTLLSVLEDYEISCLVEERMKKDNGKRYF